MNFKKIIKQNLEKIFNEKGFMYDTMRSKPNDATFVYSRGVTELQRSTKLQIPKGMDLDLLKEFINNQINTPPEREEIIIYRNRWEPTITIDLRSIPKKQFKNLSFIVGFSSQKWWSISNENEIEKSFEEIVELLNKYAWNWFDLEL